MSAIKISYGNPKGETIAEQGLLFGKSDIKIPSIDVSSNDKLTLDKTVHKNLLYNVCTKNLYSIKVCTKDKGVHE